MVTESDERFLRLKSFSSCFLEYRVSAILLRLFSFAAVGRHRTGDIPLRVQKSPWFRTGFFASKNPEKSAHSEGKYDLRSICLFFCKGHL